jgi:UDP-N-acetylmuramate dehydrogenase
LRSGSLPIDPQPQVALAPFSTLGVGGAAEWFLRAGVAGDVSLAHQWADERGLPMVVLGGGSNVVIADEGLPGLVVQMGIHGIDLATSNGDTWLAAGAGEPWDPIVARVVEAGLAGVECLSGIPGTVGGTPIQNVGAYGQDVSGVIDRVDVYDRVDRAMRTLTSAECRFAYRMSRFKRDDADRFVVCGVTFRLRPGPPTASYPDIVRYLESASITSPVVADVRRAVLDVRRRKGMVVDAEDADTRSVGSFFMNPVVGVDDQERVASIAGEMPPGFSSGHRQVKLPAAWLIERAGFQRGQRDGAVAISSKHTLALVNRGGASARDVLRLATRIKRTVVDRFGVWLRPEPVFLGFSGDPDVEYLQSEA